MDDKLLDSYNDMEKGDWVRFCQGGRLLIGQVEYFVRQVGGMVKVYTDVGVVNADSVLEVRKPQKA